MEALAKALGRHSVTFTARTDVPLVVDREALAIIDRGRIVALDAPAQLKAQMAAADATLEDVFIELTGRSL